MYYEWLLASSSTSGNWMTCLRLLERVAWHTKSLVVYIEMCWASIMQCGKLRWPRRLDFCLRSAIDVKREFKIADASRVQWCQFSIRAWHGYSRRSVPSCIYVLYIGIHTITKRELKICICGPTAEVNIFIRFNYRDIVDMCICTRFTFVSMCWDKLVRKLIEAWVYIRCSTVKCILTFRNLYV